MSTLRVHQLEHLLANDGTSPPKMKPRRDSQLSNAGDNLENIRKMDVEPECKRMKPEVLREMGIGVLEDYDEPPTRVLKDTKPLTNRSKLSPTESVETRYMKENIEEIHTFSSPFSDDFSFVRRRRSQLSGGIDHFNKLSDEMLLMIFRWLPKRELTRCTLVCRRFRRVACDEGLWTRVDLGCKTVTFSSLACVVQRGVRILRLAQAEVKDPLSTDNLFPVNYESKLQYLDLSMAIITPECLAKLLQRTTHLIKLSLEHCILNQDCCEAIAKNENLDVLNLAMCYNVEAAGVKAILTGCRRISELNLAWAKLSVETLDTFTTCPCPTLRLLNLSGCRQSLLDRHLSEIVHTLPNLSELDVSDGSALTGASFEAVCSFQYLERLAISRCYNVSGVNLLKLSGIPGLVSVEVFGLLNESGLTTLRSGIPEIEINKNPFSKIARPTVGVRRTSVWGLRVRD